MRLVRRFPIVPIARLPTQQRPTKENTTTTHGIVSKPTLQEWLGPGRHHRSLCLSIIVNWFVVGHRISYLAQKTLHQTMCLVTESIFNSIRMDVRKESFFFEHLHQWGSVATARKCIVGLQPCGWARRLGPYLLPCRQAERVGWFQMRGQRHCKMGPGIWLVHVVVELATLEKKLGR